MSDPRLDGELKEGFQRLRSEDRAAAPDFARMMAEVRAQVEEGTWKETLQDSSVSVGGSRHRAGPRSGWLWAGGSLAAAAAAAALLLLSPQARADREFEQTVRAFTTATAGWRTPTDELLDMPGIQIMKTVPSIGGWNWPGGADGAPAGDRS
ncbi:MAG: hypothetical protein R3E10_09595 [Gemmatimonadota bacterium]